VWWPVPGPWEWPECEKPRAGGPGGDVLGGVGRFMFISGTVNTRSAGAPSAGHAAPAAASLTGRDTTNSRPHVGQRNG